MTAARIAAAVLIVAAVVTVAAAVAFAELTAVGPTVPPAATCRVCCRGGVDILPGGTLCKDCAGAAL